MCSCNRWKLWTTLATIWVSVQGLAAAADATAVRAALDSIRTEDLKTHIDVLADDSFEGREAGSRGGRAAAVYLLKAFEKQGLKPAGTDGGFYQSFDAGYRNVLGMLPGSDPQFKEQVILVGAHYDHVGYGTLKNSHGPIGYIHNGADDNASGVAGLLELIEAFGMLPAAPKRSILFAFWDGEEKGLLGSKYWTAQPTIPLAQVPLAVNVDMIGRLRGESVEVLGTRTGPGLRQLVSRQNANPQLQLDFTWELKDNSDHWSFVSRNVPVLMWHTGLHDDYHRPSDDAHKVNVPGMRDVVQLMFSTLVAVADEPVLPTFRGTARYESPVNQQEFERALTLPPPRLGVWWDPPAAGERGVKLSRIVTESPAAQAGLLAGDRVLKFGGVEISGDEQLRALVVAATNPVEVIYQREGKPEPQTARVELLGKPARVGISWRESDAEPKAVTLVQVLPGSPADRAGLKTGDRIYEVAGRPFRDGTEFLALMASQPLPMELLVERRGRVRAITLPATPSAAPSASAAE